MSVRICELPWESVRLVWLSEKFKPWLLVAVSNTVPLNPFALVSVMTESWVQPACMVKLDCDADRAKSGGGGMGTTLNVTWTV